MTSPKFLTGFFATKHNDINTAIHKMISLAETSEDLKFLKKIGVDLNMVFNKPDEVLKSEARLKMFIEAGLDINHKAHKRECYCPNIGRDCLCDRENFNCGCNCRSDIDDCLLFSNLTPEQLRIALDNGADLHADVFGRKAIHVYAEIGNLEHIKILCEYGADIDSVASDTGRRPIHYAIDTDYGGNYNVVKFLIDSGCDVNARGFNDKTPLMCATGVQNIHICKLLVAAGCDMKFSDKDIKDFMYYSNCGGYTSTEIKKFLKSIFKK